MVLSNTKLKRKKREEAGARAVLNPLPDSNPTSSLGHDVCGGSLAILSSNEKEIWPKSKAVNGDAGDGTSGSVLEGRRDISSVFEVSVDGNVPEGERVRKSKKKQKATFEDGLASATLVDVDVEDVGRTLTAVLEAGVSEEKGVGGGVLESGLGQEEAPKTKVRKKPRWEVDEKGKRVKPPKVVGEGEQPSNNAKASASSGEGIGVGDVINRLEEKDGDASVAALDCVNHGDRIHQGDEPWLQSKRRKVKKKLTDRWGKKLDDAEVVHTDLDVNQEALQISSSAEKVDPKKVMVGGMPYYVSEDDIHEYFQECGTIAELDCMTFPDTGKFKGIAFITFRTEEAAKRAFALDGADMGGRFLKIEICKVRPKEPAKKDAYKVPPQKYEGCLSAYIGNLAWDVTEKDLRNFFKGCRIDSIRFALNKETEEFRGFGHVDFADDESLEAAMKLDQMPVLGRPVKIAYSVPPKNKPVEARKGPPGSAKKGCFTCGEEGHMSYNCPKKL